MLVPPLKSGCPLNKSLTDHRVHSNEGLGDDVFVAPLFTRYNRDVLRSFEEMTEGELRRVNPRDDIAVDCV